MDMFVGMIINICTRAVFCQSHLHKDKKQIMALAAAGEPIRLAL